MPIKWLYEPLFTMHLQDLRWAKHVDILQGLSLFSREETCRWPNKAVSPCVRTHMCIHTRMRTCKQKKKSLLGKLVWLSPCVHTCICTRMRQKFFRSIEQSCAQILSLRTHILAYRFVQCWGFPMQMCTCRPMPRNRSRPTHGTMASGKSPKVDDSSLEVLFELVRDNEPIYKNEAPRSLGCGRLRNIATATASISSSSSSSSSSNLEDTGAIFFWVYARNVSQRYQYAQNCMPTLQSSTHTSADAWRHGLKVASPRPNMKNPWPGGIWGQKSLKPEMSLPAI